MKVKNIKSSASYTIALNNPRSKVFSLSSIKIDYKLFFILLIGILVRILEFGNMPFGFNQDEAFDFNRRDTV